MGIFRRVSDIVSANLNDMVENFEEPEKMLRQAVREMEASIADNQQQVARAMASEKLVSRELEKNRRDMDLWRQRAERAVQDGNDDLARKGLARRREHQRLAAALEDQHKAANEATGNLRRQLEGMQAKLAEAKRRLGTLAARQRAAEVRAKVSSYAGPTSLKNDAFAKFDRLQEKVEMAEAEADAMRELLGESPAAAEPDPATPREESDLEIEEELRQIKVRSPKP